MKIGIDISQIVYGTGVSVYTQNLVKALLTIDRRNNYLLLGGSWRRQGELRRFVRECRQIRKVRSRILPFPPTLADFFWNKLHVLPIERLVGLVDVFHASDWTQPPAKRARLVTTIHDLGFLEWPESVHPQVLAAQKRRLEWVKKEADLVIAVSEATKKEVAERLEIPEKKVMAIHEGVPEDAKKFTLLPAKAKRLKLSLGITKPYVFAYGSQAPRKNIDRIIEAFKPLKDYQLVIVGEYRSEKRLAEGVVLTGFLPRQELLSLFAGAEALVFPSLYEGFGLPILEAFVLGVPVVTSNISSMPEVAGKAAVLVDPFDVQDITRGLEKALKERERLVKLGFKQAKQFSWQKTAKQTLKVYEALYS